MTETEPTMALDDVPGAATAYVALRELKAEISELEKRKKKLEAELKRAVGNASVATFYGEVAITNRPTATFRGNDFSAEQPILAKEYTRPVVVDQLDLKALESDHPAIYAQYRSRQFKVLDV